MSMLGVFGALLAIVGMSLGATAFDVGPLATLRVALQQAIPNAASWRPPLLASAATGVLLLAALSRLAPGRAGAWEWRTTGLWVGATAALAWPVAAGAGRDFGLAVMSTPRSAVLAKRFAGGLGLVVGASIATGCTVGQGLTGLALLAPSSFVLMGAIFAGSALATLAARRLDDSLDRAAAPAITRQ